MSRWLNSPSPADVAMAEILGINPSAIISWSVDQNRGSPPVAEVTFVLTPEQMAKLMERWATKNAPHPGVQPE